VTVVPARRRLLLPALVGLLSLVLAACGGEPATPQERLAEAFESSFSDGFSFTVALDADSDALASLGADAGPAASILNGLGLSGSMDEDGNLVLRVSVLGSDVFEARGIGEEESYFRLDVADLVALAGGDIAALQGQLGPALDGFGLAPEIIAAVDAGLSGEWVGIEGQLDPAAISGLSGASELPDEEEAEAAVRARFGEDVPAFFERFLVVGEESTGEGESVSTFAVSLKLRELIQAAAQLNADLETGQDLGDLEADLAELPELVPGTIQLTDDVVTSLRFDVAETIREAGGTLDGAFEVVVGFSEHGEVPEVEAPDASVVVDAEVLTESIETLLQQGVAP
jgi:hypothetical protein